MATAAVRPAALGLGRRKEDGSLHRTRHRQVAAPGVDPVGGDQSFEKCFTRPASNGRADQGESEYRQQLQEKQKVCFTYGVMEKQFRRYYEEGSRSPARPGEPAADPGDPAGHRRVPRRLGAHPAGWPASWSAIGHFTVNGVKVIPSHRVSARHHRCPGQVAEHRSVRGGPRDRW